MTPGDIATIGNLIMLVEKVSQWPVIMIVLLIIVGPWVMTLIFNMQNQKRFETVVRMYENNTKLVDDYKSVTGDLKEVVIMNTQAVSRMCMDIEHNEFCPAVRLEKHAKGVQV